MQARRPPKLAAAAVLKVVLQARPWPEQRALLGIAALSDGPPHQPLSARETRVGLQCLPSPPPLLPPPPWLVLVLGLVLVPRGRV